MEELKKKVRLLKTTKKSFFQSYQSWKTNLLLGCKEKPERGNVHCYHRKQESGLLTKMILRLILKSTRFSCIKEDFEKFMNGLQQAIDFIGHEQGTTSETHYQPATTTEEIPSQSEEIKLTSIF